jgi:hypothetical protein
MNILHLCIRYEIIVDSFECKVQFANVYFIIFVPVHVIEGVLIMRNLALINDTISEKGNSFNTTARKWPEVIDGMTLPSSPRDQYPAAPSK